MRCLMVLTFMLLAASGSILPKSPEVSVRQDANVVVSLYYECLCPYCKGWITDQLVPTYQRLSKYMEVELYPYGNAHQEASGDSWVFTCQHGPRECKGNIQQACVLNYVQDQDSQISIVHCIENSPGDITEESNVRKCLVDNSVGEGVVQKILECANNEEGIQLEHKIGVTTDNLKPEHEYVPWVTFNHMHDGSAEACQDDLFNCLCHDFLKGVPECDEVKRKRVSFNNWYIKKEQQK